MFDTEQPNEMHRIGILGSINDNITNVSSTPPPEVENNSIIVN